MATKVSGTTYNGDISSVKFTDWFTYAVSETSTQYTLTLTAGMHFVAPTNYIIDAKTVNITGTGQTSKSGTISRFTSSGSAVDKTGISSFTWSWTKGHSSASKTITAYQTGHSGTKASKAFTVPAKPSYAVSYNANSGTGQPSNDTKWYNEPLTLSTSRPTKEGYTFKGWATSVANAGTNTTTTTYTGNAPATFYATWELNYSKPSITNISIERCDANGNNDDEGGYAKVNFDWSVFASSASRYYGGNTYPYANNTISSASVTVGTFTKSFTASDTLPIIVGDGSFSTDTQYDVSITITDTQSVISDHTTTVAGTLATSFFPMDFNADGTAMGIFRPAPDPFEEVATPGSPVENGYYELVNDKYVASTDTIVDSEKTYYSYIDVSGVYLGKDLYIKNTKMTDFVVEQGTDNSWTYRKWNSGNFEAWRYYQATGLVLTSASAGTYYGDPKTIPLPSFATTLDCCTYGNTISQGSGIYIYNAQKVNANLSIAYRAHASQSNGACGGYFHIIGRWQ